jgi:hypothetical protein
MRLKKVENGHTLGTRLKLKVIGLVLRRRAPDVVRTIFYRPELFGRAFSGVLDECMRGESNWSVGERELFAAFTSRLNQCPF